MKVIDLLNKIANGEEYRNCNLIWHSKITGQHMKENIDAGTFIYESLFYKDITLNDEVEILEEEPRDIEVCGSLFTKSGYDKLTHSEEEKKIPEKLIPTSLKGIDNLDEKIEIAHIDTISVIETVNQLIDYLKSKENNIK